MVEGQTTTNTTNINNLQGRMGTAERDISGLKTQTAANTTSITTLQGEVGSLGGRTTNVENRVAGLESRVDQYGAKVDGMDSRVTHAEQASQKALQGVAVALSVSDPVLMNGDVFGMRVNYGHFEGQSALGFSAMGVLGRNVFGHGETLAIGGGLGFGLNDHSVGGRVGLQLSWK